MEIALHPGESLPRLDLRGQPGYPAQDGGPKISGLGRAVWRRAKLLVATIVILNAIAFVGIREIAPRYTSSADLLVGQREEQVVDLKAVLAGLSGSTDVIESEIQVVRSRQIAREVVRKLNLDQLVEFNPSLREPGPRQKAQQAIADGVAWLTAMTAQYRDQLGFPSAPPEPTTEAPGSAGSEPLDPLSGPVDRFLSQLEVAGKGRSRVITITFTSTDPVLAAKVPNAVSDAYVANQLRAKTSATAQAHKWLDERVSELREQLMSEDEAVEAYRRRAGIIPLRDSTLLGQQISELGQELMRAREQVAMAKSRQQAVAGVTTNALGLNREVAAAQAREAALNADLDTLRKQIASSSQSEIGLRALQREADADRNLYDRLLARARETKIQSGLQQADATIISRAERPIEASFPKPAVILPIYFVASFLGSILLVIWLETLDSGIRTVSDVEKTLGIAAIGAIPLVKRRIRGRAKVANYALARPKSTYAEAIRNLYTSVILSGKTEPPKTILVASSLPGEGKSSVSLAMATTVANWGRRVVVVDCDLRNPSVHRAFAAPHFPGLTDCLAGKISLEAALCRDPDSSAWFLPAGEAGTLAPDLISSPAMQRLLRDLSAQFDLVILDGGPVLGTSDTRHLCRLADRTVFLIRWQDTRCSAALLGLRQLADAGANFAGAILTMVDPKHYRKYSPVSAYSRRLALYLSP